MARKTVPFARAHKGTTCSPCNGKGQVLVDPSDARKGTKSCPNCGGNGER